MAVYDKVRIVVVGDSGVGKTSLVHLIADNEAIENPYWTIGCSVEVKLHEYKAGTPAEKNYYVELWDIGGFAHHENSRGVFYNPVNGIILVHDLTNRKSHQNLRKWLAEVLNKDEKGSYEDYDRQSFSDVRVPVLVIGTKLDLVQAVRNLPIAQRSSLIAEECGADEINLDTKNIKHLAPGTSNAVKISRFFDRVIQKRYNLKGSTQITVTSTSDRRRQFHYFNKASL